MDGCKKRAEGGKVLTWRVLSHLEMQWKWKAWLHIPQATVHSSLVALAWLAWHSMHRSMMWFLVGQIVTFYPYTHSSGNTGTQ